MRTLLIVVFVAAVVGIVITKVHRPSVAPGQTARGAAAVKPAPAVHTEAPEVLVRAPAAAPLSQPTAPTRLAARAAPAQPSESALRKASPVAPAPRVLSATAVLPARATAAPTGAVAPKATPVALNATAVAPKAAPAGTEAPVAGALTQAQALLAAGKRMEARDLLTPLYLRARGVGAAQLKAVLDGINSELVFNPRCVEGATTYTVVSGDSLVRIGKKFGVNWRMIGRLNGMDEKSILRQGQKLKVLEGKPSIVVHKGEFRMDLLWNGAYVKEYPVGIGKPESPTVDGQFVVKDMMIQAPWTKPGGGVVKYGEEGYALGERWISFENKPGANGLGIHGTNEENTVGTMCSNGCVRLRNADVIELYDFVVPGTQVTIEE